MTAPGAPALEPGMWVKCPACPDWGVGQVQSAIGARVTVNFVEAGKPLINIAIVPLEILDGPPLEGAARDET